MKFLKFKRTLFALMLIATLLTAVTGGTIAWFTDSVTSSSNIIQSGTLDVEMSWAEGKTDPANTTWADASTGAIFDYDLWEPGYVEVRHVKIENKGTLALKYNLKIVPTGEVSNLAEVIDIYYADPAVKAENRMLSGMDKIGTLKDFIALNADNTTNTASGNLEAGQSHTVTLALKMQESAGNDYQGVAIGSSFSVVLDAAQLVFESDSFDNTYDEGARLPGDSILVRNSAELKAAFEEGGNIKLVNDIELDDILRVAQGDEVYLDMNGKTITAAREKAPVFYPYTGSTLTIAGNGTVNLPKPSMYLVYPAGDVIIENGTFVRNVPEGTPDNEVYSLFAGVKVNPWGSQSVTINGGYFDGGYYNKDAANIEELLAGTKTLEETADDIAKRGISGDKNKVRVALKDNVMSFLNMSYNLIKVYGGTFVGVNPAWGDEGCMLPTTPNYLRPWSYYQGAFLDGQTFNEDGIVLPEGYSITETTHDDGRPVYTVTYSKP